MSVAPISTQPSSYRAMAFGLTWDSDVELPAFSPSSAAELPADITIRRAREPRHRRPSTISVDHASLCTDGVHFRVGDEVTFDTFGGSRVEWTAGSAWTGTMPQVFFGTIAAILLGWRGAVPVHGAAVDAGGRAVVIVGANGTGKSSLAAALIALGATLVSDDLTVLNHGAASVQVFAGRRGIRLRPDSAQYLDHLPVCGQFPAADKQLLLAPQVAPFQPRDLSTVVLLAAAGDPVLERQSPLTAHVYRPKWIRALPGLDGRKTVLQRAHEQARIIHLEPADAVRSSTPLHRAEALLRLVS